MRTENRVHKTPIGGKEMAQTNMCSPSYTPYYPIDAPRDAKWARFSETPDGAVAAWGGCPDGGRANFTQAESGAHNADVKRRDGTTKTITRDAAGQATEPPSPARLPPPASCSRDTANYGADDSSSDKDSESTTNDDSDDGQYNRNYKNTIVRRAASQDDMGDRTTTGCDPPVVRPIQSRWQPAVSLIHIIWMAVVWWWALVVGMAARTGPPSSAGVAPARHDGVCDFGPLRSALSSDTLHASTYGVRQVTADELMGCIDRDDGGLDETALRKSQFGRDRAVAMAILEGALESGDDIAIAPLSSRVDGRGAEAWCTWLRPAPPGADRDKGGSRAFETCGTIHRAAVAHAGRFHVEVEVVADAVALVSLAGPLALRRARPSHMEDERDGSARPCVEWSHGWWLSAIVTALEAHRGRRTEGVDGDDHDTGYDARVGRLAGALYEWASAWASTPMEGREAAVRTAAASLPVSPEGVALARLVCAPSLCAGACRAPWVGQEWTRAAGDVQRFRDLGRGCLSLLQCPRRHVGRHAILCGRFNGSVRREDHASVAHAS
jgi:hypothetical protein